VERGTNDRERDVSGVSVLSGKRSAFRLSMVLYALVIIERLGFLCTINGGRDRHEFSFSVVWFHT
jgi:hypothetical protein